MKRFLAVLALSITLAAPQLAGADECDLIGNDDLRHLCCGEINLIDSRDLRRVGTGDCDMVRENDWRNLCLRRIDLIQDSDLRQLSKYDCFLIGDDDLRHLCRGWRR